MASARLSPSGKEVPIATTPLSNANPSDVARVPAAPGVDTEASRGDHQHDCLVAAPAALQAGQGQAGGSAQSLSRSDHQHAVPVGVPVATGLSNLEGSALTSSRSDHVHATAGSSSAPNQSTVAGASTTNALDNLLTAINSVQGLKFFGASDFDDPNNANWAVGEIALIGTDSNQAMIVNRRFDDTTEQGVGMDQLIPAGSVSVEIGLISRAESAPGAAAAVQPALYTRQVPDNLSVPAWSAGLNLTLVDIPTNEFWQYDTQTVTLAALGLTAGTAAFFELTRRGTAGGDSLSGLWDLYGATLRFIA